MTDYGQMFLIMYSMANIFFMFYMIYHNTIADDEVHNLKKKVKKIDEKIDSIPKTTRRKRR